MAFLNFIYEYYCEDCERVKSYKCRGFRSKYIKGYLQRVPHLTVKRLVHTYESERK